MAYHHTPQTIRYPLQAGWHGYENQPVSLIKRKTNVISTFTRNLYFSILRKCWSCVQLYAYLSHRYPFGGGFYYRVTCHVNKITNFNLDHVNDFTRNTLSLPCILFLLGTNLSSRITEEKEYVIQTSLSIIQTQERPV